MDFTFWELIAVVAKKVSIFDFLVSYRTFRKQSGNSDLHNFPCFPVNKTIVSDTFHREMGAGSNRPIGAPR